MSVDSRKIEKLEIIDLIASGYEWTCPRCGKLNNEIEITHIAQCIDCGDSFRTGTADHVWG